MHPPETPPSYAHEETAARRSILSDYTPHRDRYGIHLLLFAVTFVACVVAGGYLAARTALWGAGFEWLDPVFLGDGLRYAIALLLFLTVHEFGHYFAARYHRVNTSLPYYIPFPLFFIPGLFNIGTFGAVIRIREPIPSLCKLFDIGAAGPLAGFVAALAVLLLALFTLPPPEYVFSLGGHEAIQDYVRQHGAYPAGPPPPGGTLVVGQTPLFWLLSQLSPNVPPMYEVYHYPLLFAGWLGLFFTALNLLPVGQLDGGHILYAVAGPRWHAIIARAFLGMLLISASFGFVEYGPLLLGDFGGLLRNPAMAQAATWFLLALLLYYFLGHIFAGQLRYIAPFMLGIVLLTVVAQHVGEPLLQFGYYGWFLWCWLIVRFIKIDHPPVVVRQPITPRRKALALAALLIFILCFSFKPLYIV